MPGAASQSQREARLRPLAGGGRPRGQSITLKRLTIIGAALLVAAALAAPAAVAQEGQEGQDGGGAEGEGLEVSYTVWSYDDPEGNYWFEWSAFPGQNPAVYIPAGATVHITLINAGQQMHNLAIRDIVESEYVQTEGDTINFTFEMPADVEATVDYYCVPHESAGMIGTVATTEEAFQEAMGGGGGGVEVHELGVNFLAYWVGIISFAALFIVYGATFFLFKYGESSATTDHKDRGDEPKGDAARRGRVIGLVLGFIVIAGVAALTAWRQGLIG